MRGRILVVEDEFFIAKEIADALVLAGFEVLGPCPTVRQALSQLDGAHCDAAVLDASLRDESSLPVAQVLTQRRIPFIVVTGFSSDQLPEELAAVTVLSKPLDAQNLISHLGQIISAS
jgi:DNA-binding response OmpR family regulator